jgi:hypothetical protein
MQQGLEDEKVGNGSRYINNNNVNSSNNNFNNNNNFNSNNMNTKTRLLHK